MKCPKCGALASFDGNNDPYCAYIGCLWNNEESEPSDGDYARTAQEAGAVVDWSEHGHAPIFNTWGQWGRFCDAIRAAPAQAAAGGGK